MLAISEYVFRKINSNYLRIEFVFAIICQIIGRYVLTIQGQFAGKLAVLVGNMHVCLMAYGLMVIVRIVKAFFGRDVVRCYIAKFSPVKLSWFATTLGMLMLTLLFATGNSFIVYEYGLFMSLIAWMIEWGIAGIIERILILKRLMTLLGKRTLPIMLGHMAAFKVVNLIVVKAEGLPYYFRGAFLAINCNKWWALYFVLGLILPLLCYSCYDELRKRLKGIERL